MNDEQKIKQLESWVKALSRKIRTLEDEIERIKKYIGKRKIVKLIP